MMTVEYLQESLAALADAHETSLSVLTESEWSALSNTWARGVDWSVSKIGKLWQVSPRIGNFPLFKTKKAASKAADTLILLESRFRARLRVERELKVVEDAADGRRALRSW